MGHFYVRVLDRVDTFAQREGGELVVPSITPSTPLEARTGTTQWMTKDKSKMKS